ncbi:MAG: glycosyltransferase family 9 protein [Nitrospirae bacterium]|nr:glycosyltransferase family 9 protein [Nitrospirota bacterium]
MKKVIWKILHPFHHPVTFSKKDIRDILVIRMNRIGDMICTIPLLKTLRKEFPEARLTVLAEETNVEVIKNASYIDKLLIYKKGAGIYRNKILNLKKNFKGNNFDIAIAVKGGFSSNLATATFLSGAAYRIGYISDNHHLLDFLYNMPVKKTPNIQHQVERCLNLLKHIGITPDRFVKDISFEIPQKSVNSFKNFLNVNNISSTENELIVLNISNDRPNTSWPVENFMELIKRLKAYPIKCIITSAPQDSENAKKLANTSSALFYETPHIMDFAAATERGNLLICHDSGAMHIGASVGTKTLVLVGRGIIPEIWGPYGSGHKCLIKPKIKDITVDDVYEEALKMLNTK